MAAGTALAAAVTGAGTGLEDRMFTGLVVGAAQSTLLARAGVASVAWTSVTAASWSLGWLTTWAYLTDIEPWLPRLRRRWRAGRDGPHRSGTATHRRRPEREQRRDAAGRGHERVTAP